MSDRIRFGFHGSKLVATQIIHAAGRRDDDIELSQYEVADPFRRLRGGDLDVMIVKFKVAEPDLACSSPLFTDARAAVMSANHPLSHRDSVSIEELADFDAFKCPDKFPEYVWNEVVPKETPSGRPIHRRHEVTSTAAMMALVAGTNAVHISLLSLADIAPPAVRIVPIHDLPPAPVALAWCRDHRSAALRDFVAAAETALARRSE